MIKVRIDSPEVGRQMREATQYLKVPSFSILPCWAGEYVLGRAFKLPTVSHFDLGKPGSYLSSSSLVFPRVREENENVFLVEQSSFQD